MKQKILLLGVAFHDESQSPEPKRGQGFRDRIRCEALEKSGYLVRTLDDKHEPSISKDGKHCEANFADARRMTSSMDLSWGYDRDYSHIILDYFFSPAGWARTRWTDKFYKETIPRLASENFLCENGKIWLPNLECVTTALNDFIKDIEEYYTISYIENPLENPLYAATENVEKELLECPDRLTNNNQIQPILDLSKDVFICLTLIPENERKVLSVSSSTSKDSPTKKRKTSKSLKILT